MLVLHSPEHGWKKCRCRECAGEAVPELPELEVRISTFNAGLTAENEHSFVKIGALVPQDFKTRAVGEEQ
jgi:hypothetical protein